ncbi:tetraspanin Pls1 family [Obba rivulosa]|uniref:Tetraspanin Pls1 family n=1 Tax=Obba rivulosa TaxID=1052685 RepID=A0A8E2DTA3_9APHY|nr:tetraspanin Pls1 family [Obba rivulosa]
MVSKALMGAWGFFDLCLLTSAILSIAFSVVWRQPNLMLNFTLDTGRLDAGLILGILLLMTFFLSLGAAAQRNNVTKGFVLLNWMLILDAFAVLIVGSLFWFITLQERNHYFGVFQAASNETRLALQNKFSCCGYFTQNESSIVIGGANNFCANETFVASLVSPANDTGLYRCVGPITAITDVTLNDIFTSVRITLCRYAIYGFMAVVICLFLASLCVINKRVEEERFRKIDLKRGGSGFV